jgi:NADH-ubiquinone oxidoreductase chain 2
MCVTTREFLVVNCKSSLTKRNFDLPKGLILYNSRLLAYNSIRHVGYLFISFSCGTIEGIQSLLIGVFTYVLMTINVFAIVLALCQNHFKYIADLGVLAKTNPILAITLSITMFSYARIPPLVGFCSKFYLFFAALGCGAYLLALIRVVTSVINCFTIYAL